MSVEKVNESEPDRRRIVNFRSVVKTAEVRSLRDQSGGYLPTAQMATGVKAARSQLIGCSVEHGNSGLERLREMTSGENREEEYRC